MQNVGPITTVKGKKRKPRISDSGRIVNTKALEGDARVVTVCKLSSQIYSPRNTHWEARCQNAEQLASTRDVLDGTKQMTNDVTLNI